jgi:glyoxylase-like metal-dependent hydrolase (beta-lactamase superfamily II)
MIQVPENCYQLRGRLVNHCALFALSPKEDGIILLDGGFLSPTTKRWLPEFENLGFKLEQGYAIPVSHGHIDHTLNLTKWKRLTGARFTRPPRIGRVSRASRLTQK